jgi:hypothetical protein
LSSRNNSKKGLQNQVIFGHFWAFLAKLGLKILASRTVPKGLNWLAAATKEGERSYS